MKTTLLALSLCLVGCSIPELDLSKPIGIQLDSSCDAYPYLSSNLELAGRQWAKLGANFEIASEGNSYSQTIPIYCQSSIGDSTNTKGVNTVGEFDNSYFNFGKIIINSVIANRTNVDDSHVDPMLVIIAAHELGHALGLSHELDSQAVMYWIYNLGSVNATDAGQFCDLHQGSPACNVQYEVGSQWPDVDTANH